jgi:hypothetical protein
MCGNWSHTFNSKKRIPATGILESVETNLCPDNLKMHFYILPSLSSLPTHSLRPNLTSTCTDISEERVASIFRDEVSWERKCIVSTSRRSLGPTGVAEEATAWSGITGSPSR